MKTHLTAITKRLIAGIVVAVAVVGLSAFTMRTPSQNSAGRSLSSIQTDTTVSFYADVRPRAIYFVEQVLPGTGESEAATENLKLIAAAL